jgi:hypothetical protein
MPLNETNKKDISAYRKGVVKKLDALSVLAAQLRSEAINSKALIARGAEPNKNKIRYLATDMKKTIESRVGYVGLAAAITILQQNYVIGGEQSKADEFKYQSECLKAAISSLGNMINYCDVTFHISESREYKRFVIQEYDTLVQKLGEIDKFHRKKIVGVPLPRFKKL